jgi:hypothetical protein
MLLYTYMPEETESSTTGDVLITPEIEDSDYSLTVEIPYSERQQRYQELFTTEKLHQVALILYPPETSTEKLFGQQESAEPFDVNNINREVFFSDVMQFTRYILSLETQTSRNSFESLINWKRQVILGTAILLERYMTTPKTDEQASLTSDESLPLLQPTEELPEAWLENTGFNEANLAKYRDIRSVLNHCVKTSISMITSKPVQSERTFG